MAGRGSHAIFYPTTVVAREGLVLRLCQQFQTLVLGKTEEVPQPRTQHVASLPGTSACGHAGDEAYVRCGCVPGHVGPEASRVMAIIRAIVGGLDKSGSEAAVRSECDKQSDGEHPTCSVILGRRFVLMVRGRARMHCGRSSSPHPHTNRCQLELVPVPFDFGRVLGVVLPDQWQSALTQYAFKHARRDPRMRGSWEFANPSFLVSWGQQHQPPHLDLLRPLFQFTLGMMLEVPHYLSTPLPP